MSKPQYNATLQVGQDSQYATGPRGRKAVLATGKNVPSVVNVFGHVDLGYRPDLALTEQEREWLEDRVAYREKEKIRVRGLGASVSEQQDGSMVGRGTAETIPKALQPSWKKLEVKGKVKLHHPEEFEIGVASSYPQRDMVEELVDKNMLLERVSSLEDRVMYHDTMIAHREQEIRNLARLRDAIKEKKQFKGRNLKSGIAVKYQVRKEDDEKTKPDGKSKSKSTPSVPDHETFGLGSLQANCLTQSRGAKVVPENVPTSIDNTISLLPRSKQQVLMPRDTKQAVVAQHNPFSFAAQGGKFGKQMDPTGVHSAHEAPFAVDSAANQEHSMRIIPHAKVTRPRQVIDQFIATGEAKAVTLSTLPGHPSSLPHLRNIITGDGVTEEMKGKRGASCKNPGGAPSSRSDRSAASASPATVATGESSSVSLNRSTVLKPKVILPRKATSTAMAIDRSRDAEYIEKKLFKTATC